MDRLPLELLKRGYVENEEKVCRIVDFHVRMTHGEKHFFIFNSRFSHQAFLGFFSGHH